MGEIIPFPASTTQKVTTDSFFGGCPHCGDGGLYLNVGRDHWFYCAKHKTKWCFGSNIFSDWRGETEADWKRNEYKLAEYIDVMPVFPEPTEEELRQQAEHEKLLQRIREVDKGYGVHCGPGDLLRALEKDEDPFED